MNSREAVNWLINLTADIGKSEHRDLWHYEQALSEIKDMLESQPETHDKHTETHECDYDRAETHWDVISRQAAIDALWKVLHDYEDKTEKQFQDSTELDVGDWIQHRIFVQNMSDIDRKVIQDLPSAEPDAPDTNVGDMISKSAVLDILYLDPGIDEIREKMIKNLPSVEPEIIYCKDCRHNGSFDTDCPITWNKTKNDYCSFAERMTDE